MDIKFIGLLLLFLIISINGMTFCLIVVLVGFFGYLNERVISLTPIIEVMVYLIASLIITSLTFRQLTLWAGSMFIPKLDSQRINRM